VMVGVCRAIVLCVCLSAELRLHACRISLGGEGNALYPVLSSFNCTQENVIILQFLACNFSDSILSQ